MPYLPRIFSCLLILAALVTTAHADEGSAVIAHAVTASLPEPCVAVRFAPRHVPHLYRRDVCVVSRDDRPLGKCVVLLVEKDAAVLYPLFAMPLRGGDRLQVEQRRGYVDEAAFLLRAASLVKEGGAEGNSDEKGIWNSLQFEDRSEDNPRLTHFWAATLKGGRLFGVDEAGCWRSLGAEPGMPVLLPDGTLTDALTTEIDGDELDVVLGAGKVLAAIVRPPLTVHQIFPRANPRVPTTFDDPVPTVAVQLDKMRPAPARVTRQLRACRVETYDQHGAIATLRTFNGLLVRAKMARPLFDLETGKEIDLRDLAARPPFEVVFYTHGTPDAGIVLAVGKNVVLPEIRPTAVGEVVGLCDGLARGSYYDVKLFSRTGSRARDMVTVWREGEQVGEGMLLTCPSPSLRHASTMLYARAGSAGLMAGDTLRFERRANGAYIDGDQFRDYSTRGRVRRTTDPRERPSNRTVGQDMRPYVVDMYHGGPFQTGGPVMKGASVIAGGTEIVIVGYHDGLGKLKESKLSITVLKVPNRDPVVAMRLQFHAPFEWGDPDKVLEANVMLDKTQFLRLVNAWNNSIEEWDLGKRKRYGTVRDMDSPKSRFIEVIAAGRDNERVMGLWFNDPRPLFDKKNEYVKVIAALLVESEVNQVSGMLEAVLAQTGW